MKKEVIIKDIVKDFQLEVLTEKDQLERVITRPKARRPGLEFIEYIDFLPTGHVQVLGENEIDYLHTLSEADRDMRIGNIVKYDPPCIVVTDGKEDRKSTRLNSSHVAISYAVFCLKKKNAEAIRRCGPD